uniref:Uncharacterized protein n=1 Tax=Anguilla anguilla TaxID=7936 RepID=A0A0E9Q165_ANGAN
MSGTPKVLDGIEVRALCWSVKSFPTNSANRFLIDLALCSGALSC